jgi:hypothetical protein
MNLALLGLGAALLVWHGRWLWNLSEEIPRVQQLSAMLRNVESQNLLAWPDTRRHVAWPVPNQQFTGLAFAARTAQLDWALARGPGRFGWKTLRWQLPWGGIDVLLFFPVFVGSMMIVPVLLWRMPADDLVIPGLMALSWGVMMPNVMLAMAKRPHLGIESLRPVTREAFVRQQGAGFLASFLFIVVPVMAVGLGLAWNWTGEFRRMVLPALSMVALAFLALAVMLSLLRYRFPLPILGMMVPITLGPLCVFALVSSVIHPAWQLAVVAAIVACGVMVLRSAYRRWLVADLG